MSAVLAAERGRVNANVHARIAGALYLIVICGGLFAGVVLDSILVSGDSAATAHNIRTTETLWRSAIAVHLIYLACAVAVYALLHRIFSPDQPLLAVLALVFALVSAGIEGASLLYLYAPLVLSSELAGAAALVRLYPVGFGFALFFFAGFCLFIGITIIRSDLIPRLIGGLMIAARLAYILNTIALVVAPALASILFPWVLLPSLVGESALALWLTVKGVRPPKPRE